MDCNLASKNTYMTGYKCCVKNNTEVPYMCTVLACRHSNHCLPNLWPFCMSFFANEKWIVLGQGSNLSYFVTSLKWISLNPSTWTINNQLHNLNVILFLKFSFVDIMCLFLWNYLEFLWVWVMVYQQPSFFRN